MSKIADLKEKKCKIVIEDEITIEAPLLHAKSMLEDYIEQEKKQQAVRQQAAKVGEEPGEEEQMVEEEGEEEEPTEEEKSRSEKFLESGEKEEPTEEEVTEEEEEEPKEQLLGGLSDVAVQVARIIREEGEIKRHQLTRHMADSGYTTEEYKKGLSEVEGKGLVSSEIRDTDKRGRNPRVYTWLGVD